MLFDSPVEWLYSATPVVAILNILIDAMISYYVNGVTSPSGSAAVQQSVIAFRTLLALVYTAFAVPFIHLTAILLGAPVFKFTEATWIASSFIAALAVLPCALRIVHSHTIQETQTSTKPNRQQSSRTLSAQPSTQTMGLSWVDFLSLDTIPASTPSVLPHKLALHFSFWGSWIGGFIMPLDKTWKSKIWPIPVVLGSLGGFVAGNVVGYVVVLLFYLRHSASSHRSLKQH